MLKMNIKQIMTEQKISIQDLHEKTGISRNTISLLYNNKSKGIQFDTLTRLADALGVEFLDELFIDEIPYKVSQVGYEIDYNSELEKNYEFGFCYLELFVNEYFENGFPLRIATLPILLEKNDFVISFNANREAFFDSGDGEKNENKILDFFKHPIIDLELFLMNLCAEIIKEKKLNAKYVCFNSDISYQSNINFCWNKEMLYLDNKLKKELLDSKYLTLY